MIASLAREQLRSQRRYILWAAGVVALAVGVASYGALIAVELDQATDATNHALVYDTENAAWIAVQAPGSEWGDVPLADFTAAVDAALEDGIRAGADVELLTLDVGAPADGMHYRAPTAVWGDVDWDAIVTEGVPPTTGEVALSEAYAREIGLGIGDEVAFYLAHGERLPVTATVSGLTRSPVEAAGVWLPGLRDVWIARDDIERYSDAALDARGDESSGVILDALVTWTGDSPDISVMHGPQTIEGAASVSGDSSSQQWVWLATGVLILGSIAMAFAFGRAQAQSRTQWVATARALGATRRHVVLATLAEAGVLAAFGAVVGYALGTVGATAHLLAVHAQVPGAGIASVAGFSPLVALVALGLALLLSLVITGVPAFWATRVNPAAALKPENDVTTAEVGRRVRFWPVSLVWAGASIGAFAAGVLNGTDDVVAMGLLLLTIVLSPVVANELLRTSLPRIGRWLARRPEKTALVAGDMLVARPRQFTVPALLVALGSGALLTGAMNHIVAESTMEWQELYLTPEAIRDFTWPAWLNPATFITMGSVIALATVIAVATNTVTEREHATREALGVSTRQSRGAAGLAHMVSLLAGLVVGVAFAALLTAVQVPLIPLGSAMESTNWDVVFDLGVSAHATVAGVSLAFALVSAGLVAAGVRTPKPSAKQSRTSAKV